MSSAFYHEGLGYVTQHVETFGGATTSTHACAWDPDCKPECAIEGSETCKPLAAKGYDGGKIPGVYFNSPKGAPGFPEFANFVTTFYLIITMKSPARVVVPALYKGPSAEEGHWDFQGVLVHSTFKAASFTRRLENCAYPSGRPTSNGVDKPGIDCGFVKDTSPLAPYFGIPVYWTVMLGDIAPGWDPDITNAGDTGGISNSKQVTRTSCKGSIYCSDIWVEDKGSAFRNFLHYGYEPQLGVLIDVSLCAGLSFKWMPTTRHKLLMTDEGYRFMPLFWVWNYLHLPGAFNMDLAKLQLVPAALNGFYIFLISQCMVSLVGGVACCFCGI
jgi:hypothetical protein